ncbi:MAG: hypothetical protein HY673_23400 [Chloroflexi bacterium]|nr:hypothetical protein [Chloroflexota bacterium]
MTQYIRTLGSRGSGLLSELARQGKRLFTFQEAAAVYGSEDGNLRKLLFTLVKRRWLQRIEKGKYLLLPLEAGRKAEWTEHEFLIASYLVSPYYIGFRSALNYYGYTEQVSRSVFIASPRRKFKPSLEILGVTYRFVYVKPRKFFGALIAALNGNQVNISDREKTIVDCLDLPEYSGGIVEIAKALFYGRDEIDFVKMAEYAHRNGNKAVRKRLGYLLEKLEIKADAAIEILGQELGSSYALLDSMRGHTGRYARRWRVRANVSDDELVPWKERS